MRSANEKLNRETRSLASELASLKEDLGESLGSKARVSMMSLASMEKIQVSTDVFTDEGFKVCILNKIS